MNTNRLYIDKAIENVLINDILLLEKEQGTIFKNAKGSRWNVLLDFDPEKNNFKTKPLKKFLEKLTVGDRIYNNKCESCFILLNLKSVGDLYVYNENKKDKEYLSYDDVVKIDEETCQIYI